MDSQPFKIKVQSFLQNLAPLEISLWFPEGDGHSPLGFPARGALPAWLPHSQHRRTAPWAPL